MASAPIIAYLLILAGGGADAAAHQQHQRARQNYHLKVTVEYADSPLALEELSPRFSWTIPADGSHRGEMQESYKLAIARSQNGLAAALATAEPVFSNRSALRRIRSVWLESGSLYYAQVVVNTTQRRGLTSSAPVFFGTALSAADQSESAFIGMASASNTSCPWLRKDVASPPAGWGTDGKAIAYVASVGYHELYVNSRKVSDDVLSPSVSDLSKRALVRAYDISSHLAPSQPFTIGAWLGPGWSQFGSRTRLQASNIFNTTKAPLVHAVVRFYSGAEMTLLGSVHSDKTWKARLSPVEHIGLWENSNFGGDKYNASVESKGWASPGTPLDSTWELATVYSNASSSDIRILSTDVAEPNRVRESVQPKTLRWDRNVLLVEMQEVFVGWVEVQNMSGKPGGTVVINVSTVPFCSQQTDSCAHSAHPAEFNMQHIYVFGPSGTGSFKPRFSYHETAYIAIFGLNNGCQPGIIGHRISNIGLLNSTDEDAIDGGRVRTGTFSSSSDDLNAIYNASMYQLH
jgi:alpha-L-rhamnosidase